MKEATKISSLFSQPYMTVAAEYLSHFTYPWEALAGIKEYINELGKTLDPEKFDNPSEGVWIAKSAKVFASAYIGAPCIIDENAEVRHCAFIRGSAIIGKNCVVGNSTELKNAILFDFVQVPHFNYVGDSILGYRSHMGAGSITSNVKSDKTPVFVKPSAASCGDNIETGLKKFGAMLGDFVEVGCNSVLNPGTVIGKHANIYPTSCVRGFVPENSIFKDRGNIIEKY